MRIVIFGAAGPTGLLLTQQALDRGHDVTAATRHPDDFPLSAERLTVTGADATRPDDVNRVVQGVDVVVSVLGAKYSRNPISIYSTSAQLIIEAMRAAGVSRLVVTSSSAANPWSDPTWGWAERNIAHRILARLGATLYADMRRMERIVLDSGFDVTVMRPLGLANMEPPTEYAVAVGHISGRQTARRDLASAILDEVDGHHADGTPAERHPGQCIAVATTNKAVSLPATIWREGIRPQLPRHRSRTATTNASSAADVQDPVAGRAVQYSRFGDPGALELVDVKVPVPGPGQVLVTVQAAGLNPVDVKTLSGPAPIRMAETVGRLTHPSRWMSSAFPRTIGRDFVGIIEAVGPGVTTAQVGQAVLGTLRSAPGDGATAGSVATHLVAPVADITPLPDGLDLLTAASLGVVAQTASGALRALGVGPDDVLVINGATGGVGSVATQLAAQRGATVLGIASPRSADRLRSWGAIPVSYEGDVSAALRSTTPSPVTALLDCHGGDAARLARELGLSRHKVGTLTPSPSALQAAQFTGSRHARPGDLAHVADLVAQGRLHPQTAVAVPFEIKSVREACRGLIAGKTRMKLVVTIGDDTIKEG